MPLLERQEQVSALAGLLRRGLSGSGQLAVIQGPAGIGKTRLLEETQRLARGLDAEVLSARGGELEQGHPFGLVLRLLEHRISKASEDELAILFRGQAGFLKGMLTGSWSESTTAVNDEFALMHSLYWLMVNLADRRPLVLLVDDLQWADEQSLRFFLYLAQRLQDLPIVLAAAVRSGDPAAENDLFSRLMLQADLSLRLQELTVDGVRQFLQASLPPESKPEGLVEETWSDTRGNPFLLREVASTLEHRQAAFKVKLFRPIRLLTR
ncbi:AAA family ATPase [Paenarthrobacter nitroguajacolicus]|uniref:AAA family ATPase n=1 Tax=Paenarthrobacter nitroguajacolicus TaxID=211146 RepID=UPI003D24417A